MKKSKAYNVLLSTLTGLSNSIILLILNLISRNLFLQYIGIEYLSVAQVINDLLTVIAFSELGVTNAVLYMLYTPVATNNRDKVIKILYLYRNFNRYVRNLYCYNRFISHADLIIVYSYRCSI